MIDDILDETELIDAVNNNDFKLVKQLVEQGANPNEMNFMEESALSFADSYKIAKFLIENGADVNLRTSFGRSVIAHLHNPAVVQLIIENGFDLSYNRNIEQEFNDIVYLIDVRPADYLMYLLVKAGAEIPDVIDERYGITERYNELSTNPEFLKAMKYDLVKGKKL